MQGEEILDDLQAMELLGVTDSQFRTIAAENRLPLNQGPVGYRKQDVLTLQAHLARVRQVESEDPHSYWSRTEV